MILGLPVVDGHELTKVVLDSLEATVTGNNFKVVIIDNASDKSYMPNYNYSFPVSILYLEENIGFYAPLEFLYEEYPEEEIIGIAHNDVIYYERGWNERMESAFKTDPKLALVGLCGSNEIDDRGGRGGGTVCYFKGGEVTVGDRVITGQSQAAGRRTTDLIPSACLDSLFMMFRRQAIPDMEKDWSDLPLAHFIDRIWPCRLVKKGWHVATLGVEIDHLGGMTTTGNERFREDCIKWLDEHGIAWRINDDGEGIIAAERLDPRNIPCGNPETQLYLTAESRYFKEFKDTGFFPCRVHPDYTYEKVGM